MPPPESPAIRHLLLAALLTTSAHPASLVVDSFDDGTYFLSNDQSSPHSARQYGGMLGGSRYVGISTDRRATVVTSELVAGTSAVGFDTGEGPPLAVGSWSGSILFRWDTFPAASLAEFGNFLLSIATVQGAGQINVKVNGTGYGSSSTWVPVSAAGDLSIPFGEVDLGGGDLSHVASIQLVIRGNTPDFAIMIDQFQVVPEPAAWLLISGACGWGLLRRRRHPADSAAASFPGIPGE